MNEMVLLLGQPVRDTMSSEDEQGETTGADIITNSVDIHQEREVDNRDGVLENEDATKTEIEQTNSQTNSHTKTRERSILAIIPAYNESGTLEQVITNTRIFVDKVVVIDDSSTDNTASIAKEQADGVVVHYKNTGVGGAVHTGYQVAIREGHDIVIQIDGDGQHDPEYIPELIQKIDEVDADMVIGSRWLNESHKQYSVVRRSGIQFFTYEANLIGDLSITDVTSGFRAYRVDMLEELSRPENSHWALEQTLEAAREGFSITEVSVPMPPETEGSQFDLKTFLAYPPRMMLITLKILLWR